MSSFGPTCTHVIAPDHRCGSPSLRGEDFCYFHHPTRRPVSKSLRHARQAKLARTSRFTLPNVETTHSIEQAIAQVRRRIAENQIDPVRARLLLVGLEVALFNLTTARSDGNTHRLTPRILAPQTSTTIAIRSSIPRSSTLK